MGRGHPSVTSTPRTEPAASSDTLELGRAVKYLLLAGGVVAAVWAVDEHFATQREFRAFREDVRHELAQVRADIYRVNGQAVPRDVLEQLRR